LIYFVAAEHTNLVKIGTTYDGHYRERMGSLRTMSPVKLTCLGVMAGGEDVESELHWRFRHLRQHGEWFTYDESLRAFVEENTDEPPSESRLPRWPPKPHWFKGDKVSVFCNGEEYRRFASVCNAHQRGFASFAFPALERHARLKGFVAPPQPPSPSRWKRLTDNPSWVTQLGIKANAEWVSWLAEFAESQDLSVSRLAKDAVENLPEFQGSPLIC
jgi:hypothetical protein